MEPHDDLKNFPNLPCLLGTSLYTELFDDQYPHQTDQEKSQDAHQSFYRSSWPLCSDCDVNPSNDQHLSQSSQPKSDDNLQDFHNLPFLPMTIENGSELLPNGFQSLDAMPCPVEHDDYPPPVFNCDCGATFDSLEAVIRHRDLAPQHMPWHGMWEAQGEGICICGRAFDDGPALRRHIKLANVRKRTQQRAQERYFKLQQSQVSRAQPWQKHRQGSAGKSQALAEDAKLLQHKKEIDKLIVEEKLRQLGTERELTADRKITQKQRKQLGREMIEKLANQLQRVKLSGGTLHDDELQDGRVQINEEGEGENSLQASDVIQ